MRNPLAALSLVTLLALAGCRASAPGSMETMMATQAKRAILGGKDVKNPIPDTPASVAEGKAHFQHHCQICHGLDGHNTGVPFADKMSPEVADLGEKDVQEYSDGQLKWIMENGIRMTGMPGWKGVLEDEEMWNIVNFVRHLPAKGSEGTPAIFKEEAEEHQKMEHGGKPAPPKH